MHRKCEIFELGVEFVTKTRIMNFLEPKELKCRVKSLLLDGGTSGLRIEPIPWHLH